MKGASPRGCRSALPTPAKAPPLAGIHFNFNHWIKGSMNTVKRSILILKRLNHMEHLMDEKLHKRMLLMNRGIEARRNGKTS